MTLEELFEAAKGIALRQAKAQRIVRLESVALHDLIGQHRQDCADARSRGESPVEAVPNWFTALVSWAAVEIGDAEPESAARLAAAALGLRELHDSPRAQALPPARRIELMLEQRLESYLEGN